MCGAHKSTAGMFAASLRIACTRAPARARLFALPRCPARAAVRRPRAHDAHAPPSPPHERCVGAAPLAHSCTPAPHRPRHAAAAGRHVPKPLGQRRQVPPANALARLAFPASELPRGQARARARRERGWLERSWGAGLSVVVCA